MSPSKYGRCGGFLFARAFSSESGAVARSASTGTIWFLGGAPKKMPVSSALIVSSLVNFSRVMVGWISTMRACTTSGAGSTLVHIPWLVFLFF